MRLLLLSFTLFILIGCNQDDAPENDYTGRSISYPLYSASEFGVPGTIEFREKKDGAVEITVILDELDGDRKLPLHLHEGDLSNPEAPQAVLLQDYDTSEGISVTTITQLADETLFPFDRISTYDGSVKIHLAHHGDDYNILVAAGNIGKNESLGFNLQSVSLCSPALNN